MGDLLFDYFVYSLQMNTPARMVHHRRSRGAACIMGLQRKLNSFYRRSSHDKPQGNPAAEESGVVQLFEKD